MTITPPNHPGDGIGAERNRLLTAFPPLARERLRSHLEVVQLETGQLLREAGEPIREVWFPRTCVCSLLVVFEQEPPVEGTTVGCEGMVGLPIALYGHSSNLRAIAQVPGEAVRLPADALRELLDADPGVRPPILRYALALTEQTAQSVACNSRHTLEQRCARWLLLTHDRVGRDEFLLTQEFLAQMLGVRRASVSEAAGDMQAKGYIRYSRGRVRITDRAGLETIACECYRAVAARYRAMEEEMAEFAEGAQRA